MVGRLGAAALLAALVAAAFPSVLLGDRTLSTAAWVPGVLPSGPVGATAPPGPPPVRDVEGASWVDEPAPYLVHRGFAEGRFALWNDAEGLGLPLLGNPNMGALSPLQLVVNVWPSPRVQDLAWLARVLLLGLFTLGLAREIGASWLGACAAATALMLSGQTVEWIEHHPLNTDVFVPAALWAALAAARRGRRAVACLALAVGAGLLGVKPQSAFMAGLFGLLWLIAAIADRARGPRAPAGVLRALGGIVAGVVLGAGVAAVALVPFASTFEDASGLVRAGRTTQSEWTLPVAALGSLGGELAVALARLPWGAAAPALPRGLPWAGLSVLAGAALGGWATRGSWLTRALGLTVALEVLRVHGLLPVPLGSVPVLGSIQFVKYCFPLYLALALLLARGIDALPRPAAVLGVAIVTAELLWLVPRDWPPRVDLWAPAPWVAELRRSVAERPGRISGPVQLAPPLVSSALGFRDLRSIDVLTPRDAFDFVARTVAPSQGVTWILADPDPLLAATGPGANLADLRWIASTASLRAEDLPAAVRAMTTSRRLVRLFDALERQSIQTRALSGGLHDGGGDRRFHWTCETPCRFVFELRRTPEHFAAGLAAPGAAGLRARLRVASDGEGRWETVPGGRRWLDLWLATGSHAGGPATVVLEIEADTPTSVLVGGVGPAPAPEVEARREGRELAYRAQALGRLELAWRDDVAHLYENAAAFGEAFFARRVLAAPDRDAALACVEDHPGVAVACLERRADSLPENGSADAMARIVSSGPEWLHADTRSAADGVLVISRTFDEAWQATVDGARAPVLRANGALLAVPVPAGTHRVEIEYAPAAVRVGLPLSLASLAVVGLVALAPRKRRPRTRG